MNLCQMNEVQIVEFPILYQKLMFACNDLLIKSMN